MTEILLDNILVKGCCRGFLSFSGRQANEHLCSSIRPRGECRDLCLRTGVSEKDRMRIPFFACVVYRQGRGGRLASRII